MTILVNIVLYKLHNAGLTISELLFYNNSNLLYIMHKIIYFICIKYRTHPKIKLKLMESSEFWIKSTTGIN